MVDQVEVAQEAKPREELLNFCSRCFASDDGGSWGIGTIGAAEGSGAGAHCLNCGANWTVDIKIPRWAIESIRSQASWVGRRYYPGPEDKENAKELRFLRSLPTTFPGRSAEPIADEPYRWWVKQLLPKGFSGASVMIAVKASSVEDAVEASRLLLPYIPAEVLE